MRVKLVRRPGVRALALACATLAAPCAAPAPEPRAGLDSLEHIVVVYAENRSFDNLYGLFPGANGIANATPAQYTQVDADGTPLPHLPPVYDEHGVDRRFPQALPNRPFRIDGPPIDVPLSAATGDLTHSFYRSQEQIDGGRNDRFVAVTNAGALPMGYYDGSRLPMWRWARDYVLADNFFTAAFGGSFLNNVWLICACTPVDPDAPQRMRATLDARGWLARRPGSPASVLLGPPRYFGRAFTPDGFAVNNVQPRYQPSGVRPAAGGDPRYADPAQYTLPPQTLPTIGDRLTAKGISWAWYAGAWDAAVADGMQTPGATRNVIYNPDGGYFAAHHQPFNYFRSFAPGTPARAAHLKDYKDLEAGIANGDLPQVVFYKPQGTFNQHPGYSDVLSGDEHVASLVARIRGSALWRSTAIIVTYDENGGFWDHVPPPRGDRFGPGTRVPAIIVSPFAKRHYVDHTQYDTTSIIKLVTRRFGLEPLPGVRADAGDLTAAFEF